ncbi:MAG: hypothetical protein F6K28_49890, partial [Microcoleus sp. SIO2G3]|nr:hypothetical protein [Microcoleus sp. SIO2G3]
AIVAQSRFALQPLDFYLLWMIVMRNARLVAIALLLAGCNAPTPTAPEAQATPQASTAATSSPTVSSSSSPAASATLAEQSTVISETGIGAARLGMTIAQLKQELGTSAEFVVQSPFMDGFDAIAVRQNGQVQYYILYLTGQQPSDSLPIQGLMTTNPRYKTAEGVGAQTAIAQAEAAYGKATLSYNLANEGYEYVRFERSPASNVSFGTGNGNAETAGVYPNASGEFHETQQYRPDATIQSILVVCLTQGCATQ